MRPSFPELEGATFPDVGNVVCLRRVDSTNRLARHILDEYVRDELPLPDVLLIALEQGQGKGRRGRVWSSPAGQGLYATLLVSEVSDPSLLPLVVPLALCEALNRYLDGRCRIKWPNDLVVGPAKIGGILLEVPYRGQKSPAAVLGFGVNHGVGAQAVTGATSLSLELGENCLSLGRLASELVAAVFRVVSNTQDRSLIIESYRELLVHREGDTMNCRIGEETLSGAFSGVDDNGSLILDVNGTVRHLSAAEIFD